MRIELLVRCLGFLALIAVLGEPARTFASQLDPPSESVFVLDLADIVNPDDEASIQTQCLSLQQEHSVPLVVVTIHAMAEYDNGNLPVERFARAVFEQWGNAPTFTLRDDWRRGILLLISKQDRKARIELGNSWPPNYISRCVAIMNTVIVPLFKRGDYSTGTLDGVAALVQMVRGETASASAIPLTGSEPNEPAVVSTAPLDAGSTDTALPAQPVAASEVHTEGGNLALQDHRAPVRHVASSSFAGPSVRYTHSSSSGLGGWIVLGMVGLIFLSVISRALGLSTQTRSNHYYGIQNRRGRHHHHHDVGTGFGLGYGLDSGSIGHHHDARSSFGSHSISGDSFGSSSGYDSSSGSSHGGGGGATGSW